MKVNPKDINRAIKATQELKYNKEASEKMMLESFKKEMRSINAYVEVERPQLMSEAWPLHNMVICAPHIIKKKTEGGIILDPNAVEEQEDKVINYSMGLKAIKCGPEVVNVKPGDMVFQGSPAQPLMMPLINDLENETEVRRFHCVAENWITSVLRKDGKPEDFKNSEHSKATLLSYEKK